LLNLSRLHGYIRDIKAWIVRDPQRIKLRRIESSRDSIECAHQRLVSGALFCGPESSSRARALHPDEMPACASNHRIECGRFYLFNLSPVLTKLHSRRIDAIRQDATAAQEDGMPSHGCTLLDCVESDGATLGTASGPLGVNGLTGLSTDSSSFASAPSTKVAVLGSSSGRYRCISWRCRADR